jgi:hypothetical protein
MTPSSSFVQGSIVNAGVMLREHPMAGSPKNCGALGFEGSRLCFEKPGFGFEGQPGLSFEGAPLLF